MKQSQLLIDQLVNVEMVKRETNAQSRAKLVVWVVQQQRSNASLYAGMLMENFLAAKITVLSYSNNNDLKTYEAGKRYLWIRVARHWRRHWVSNHPLLKRAYWRLLTSEAYAKRLWASSSTDDWKHAKNCNACLDWWQLGYRSSRCSKYSRATETSINARTASQRKTFSSNHLQHLRAFGDWHDERCVGDSFYYQGHRTG